MKIKVNGLGVVRRAEIELKPLTIFVGPNNAGKTWLAYTIAGILGKYGQKEYAKALTTNNVQNTYPLINHVIQQVLEQGYATIDIARFAEQFGSIYINNVAEFAQSWMQEYLGTRRAVFNNLKVQVNLTDTKPDFLQQVLTRPYSNDFPRRVSREEALLNATKEGNNPLLYFYTEKDIAEKLPPQEIRLFIIDSIFEVIHSAIYLQVFTFPTERTTFITLLSGMKLGPMAPVVQTFSQQIASGQSLPVPVASFLESILSILLVNPSQREKEAKGNPSIRLYSQLALLLERRILEGGIENSASMMNISQEFLFRPTRDIALEMNVASSMVKELSPFVLYLRYLSEPGQLLVIDEPEMNLHPAAQVRFMEFLATLVNAGLNVLFTTHSTYMIDHLVNLIKAREIARDEEMQKKFFLRRADAFLSREQVAAYLIDKGETKNILGANGLIDWHTFSNVSDQVTQLYTDLVSREIDHAV